MEVLKDSLNMQDAYFHSPLKGLPRQKALRKDGPSTSGEEARPPPETVHRASSHNCTVSVSVQFVYCHGNGLTTVHTYIHTNSLQASIDSVLFLQSFWGSQ